jgi:pimeloyl-ACP methyl ester carboxylesterase
MNFVDKGTGSALVFLHGFCESLEIWNDFIPPLSDKFRILAADLPGFGKSPSLPEGFTIDHVADAVNEWLKKNNVSDFLIIGHSLGGYVALSLAERHGLNIKGICLFHSTVFPDSDEKKENRNKVAKFVHEHGVLPYVDTFVPGLFANKKSLGLTETHRIAAQTNQATLIGYLVAMRDRRDRSDWWKKSEKKKLVIAGKEDTLVPLAVSREMAGIGHNVEYFELEKTAHMGFFEAKNESQLIIARFADALFFDK